MDIRINLTVGEIRQQGILDKFCELFHYNPSSVSDDQRVILNLPQANKIGLQLDWGEQPQSEAPKKRTKKVVK